MCPDSVEEGPGIGAVETPDADGFQEFRREVSQVHPMPGTGSGVQGLPVGDNAAGPAAQAAQLVPHRAVYDLELESAEPRAGLSGATGRMVLDYDLATPMMLVQV